MPKEISCGFIIFDRDTGKILGCHPTGGKAGPEMAYDIPKGHLEEGETPFEAACRELREETGINFGSLDQVHVIGYVPYRKNKALHLFSTVMDLSNGRLGALDCVSTFVDSFGNERPEVDSYVLTDDPGYFFKNMQPHIRAEQERRRLAGC